MKFLLYKVLQISGEESFYFHQQPNFVPDLLSHWAGSDVELSRENVHWPHQLLFRIGSWNTQLGFINKVWWGCIWSGIQILILVKEKTLLIKKLPFRRWWGLFLLTQYHDLDRNSILNRSKNLVETGHCWQWSESHQAPSQVPQLPWMLSRRKWVGEADHKAPCQVPHYPHNHHLPSMFQATVAKKVNEGGRVGSKLK